MKIYSLLISMSVFISCTNPPVNKTLKNTSTSNVKPDTLKLKNEEYLDVNQVKINGKLPVISKTIKLYEVLGKPDSIVSPNLLLF
ncbi:MAG: hypothetical protein JWQ25_1406 [Daejeonella sp.]|nr:hypothetical protein [Daejeonella sp.]